MYLNQFNKYFIYNLKKNKVHQESSTEKLINLLTILIEQRENVYKVDE